MKKVALILCAFSCLAVISQPVEVLFLEVTNPQGETIYLEPGFPYAHVVLSVGNRLFHSHPKTGVSEISQSELKDYGQPKEILLVNPEKLNESLLSWSIGRGYDSEFNWSDERFYCSELVAKVIGMLPEPMHFDPELWPPSFQNFEGLPGISPGKIYSRLKSGAFLLE